MEITSGFCITFSQWVLQSVWFKQGQTNLQKRRFNFQWQKPCEEPQRRDWMYTDVLCFWGQHGGIRASHPCRLKKAKQQIFGPMLLLLFIPECTTENQSSVFFQNTSTISFLFVFFTVRIEPSLPLSLLWASLLKRSVPASLLLPVKLYIRVARLQLKHENGKRAVWKSGECDIWLIQNPTLWLWLFPWKMQHVWDICFSGVGVVTNEITLAGQQQSPMIRQTVCFSPFRNGKKN